MEVFLPSILTKLHNFENSYGDLLKNLKSLDTVKNENIGSLYRPNNDILANLATAFFFFFFVFQSFGNKDQNIKMPKSNWVQLDQNC